MSEQEVSYRKKKQKIVEVKNKTPADVQITAEQLLREAKERELEIIPPAPKQKIQDSEELNEVKHNKRKEFEDKIRKMRSNISTWIKYALWEDSHHEIHRARSIFERALDIDHRNITLWIKYAEVEMKNKQVNHARNVWDRAVSILPRANQLWYKYVYMEQILENVAAARQIFQRWMIWQPNEQAWLTFINFELRYNEIVNARNVYQQFVVVHPDVKNWIRWARFEEAKGFIEEGRDVFERALEFYGELEGDSKLAKLYVAFGKFEENCKEHERCRTIYRYALDHLDKKSSEEVFKQLAIYEKKHGTKFQIEDVVLNKRKLKYQQEIQENAYNYDSWFDLLHLMETENESKEKIREIYEKVIAQVPLVKEKEHWRRYIYFWVKYALFEEISACDFERARKVYDACLSLIPHKTFTFAKIWIFYAEFEIRRKRLTVARQILGTAIGKCAKAKLYRSYIEIELQMREFDRCRILYQKWLQFEPSRASVWVKFAELEGVLGDYERMNAVYEIAVASPFLQMPEIVWKAYIDSQLQLNCLDAVRSLYKRLLSKTSFYKVWISYAKFELESFGVKESRSVFEEANKKLREMGAEGTERAALLQAWLQLEEKHGDDASTKSVKKLLPYSVKKRRKLFMEDGSEAGWQEFLEFEFPVHYADDSSEQAAKQRNLKLLQMAKKWKKADESERP